MLTSAPVAEIPLELPDPPMHSTKPFADPQALNKDEQPPTPPPAAMVPLDTLVAKLGAGRFVVTMELVPPRSPDAQNVVDRLRRNFIGHADAVNVTDCASAVLRMGSLAASLICLREGVEPVFQLTCRDRNRIALQSDLIGAYALGIRNILLLTGDHVRFGDHPEAKAVFDLDSTNLIAIAGRMRAEGRYFSDEPARTTTKGPVTRFDWLIGGAANPYGNDPRHLALHMDKKRRAGADFLQTQPVFDLPGFERWWRALEELGLPDSIKVMPGILPPRAARGLEFMRDNVPGVRVPDECIRRMATAADPAAEGLRMTLEIIDCLLQFPIAGLHLYPVVAENLMPELAAEIRARARKAGREVALAAT